MSHDSSDRLLWIQAALTAALIALIGGISQWSPFKEVDVDPALLIKDHQEKSKADTEREALLKERRLQQAREAKERHKRRADADAAGLRQACEISRELRRRREEREAEETRARSAAIHRASEAGEKDAQGWTEAHRQKLTEAVKQYPEGWSHVRMARWEKIAEEVGGHNARDCEAAYALMQSEARAAASDAKDAKAQGRKGRDAGKPTADGALSGLDGDMDWIEGDGDYMGFNVVLSDDDDDEEEDEGEDQRGQNRMAVDTEPEHKGTCISLNGIKSMTGCASVQVELLQLQLSCADCRETTQLFLSGADEDAADAKTWCEKCLGLISVQLRPTLLHQSSNRLCYVDCVRCSVTDVLPSVLASVCEKCDAVNVHKQEFIRNRVIAGSCFSCHAKYGFGAESIKIEQVTACDPGSGGGSSSRHRSSSSSTGGSGDPMDEIAEELRYLRKKAKQDPRQAVIKLGHPLPQMGACKHFKQSFKWYRFACCGRAFPCPECHVESNCPAAALGAHASRMICGKCSMEQGYSPAKGCEKCGFSMMAKHGAHWQGGDGTRNIAAMSTKDAKKFKGGLKQDKSKTKTSSAKATRVGAKAKAQREHVRKFGSD